MSVAPPSSSPSLFSSFVSLFSHHKCTFFGLLLLSYLSSRVRYFSQSRHTTASLPPPDPHLFPHFHINSRRLWLHSHSWIPYSSSPPKAVIFLIHGFGEHAGRYQHLAQKFNAAGYAVYGLDLVGHGRSQGDRAHVERLQDYVDDIIQWIKMVQAEIKVVSPCFLYGHSMGGLLSIQVLRQTYGSNSLWPWTGAIHSAPAIIPDPSVGNPFLRFMAGFVSRLLPKLPTEKLDAGGISRIQSVVGQYQDDPLVYRGGMRARWANEMLVTMDDLVTKVEKEVRWPFLVVQGDQDRLINKAGAQLLVDKSVLSPDKELKLYGGGYHELHNDLCSQHVLTDMLQWLDRRCK